MLPIDFDHGLDDLSTKDGRAAGWITGLAVEGDRIVATVEWTTAGRNALREKLYRFISPVFYTDLFYTDLASGEVTHLASAGLTNMPALPQLKQVASQCATQDSALRLVLASALNVSVTTPCEELVAKLRMRLDPKGTAAAASNEVPSITSIPIEAPFQIGANFIAEHGKAEHAKTTAAAVEQAMYQGRLPPSLREWGLDLCNHDPDSFRKFVAHSPFDIFANLTVGKTPPPSKVTIVSSPIGDHKASICAQLNLPQGALDDR